MKRLWILMLTLCVTALFCVSALGLGAEEAHTEIWSVYSSYEDANGIPQFAAPPEYAYTPDGLRVTPKQKMETFTVQTDHAYSMEDGLYMEVKLDQPSEGGFLIFHLWDQNGLVVSNFRCGSGWQAMIQLSRAESQFMMSLVIHGAQGAKEEGTADVLGSMKINAPVAEDGSVTYTLSVKDGVMRINGSVVVGMDEAIGLLKEKRPDGSVYVGVSTIQNQNYKEFPVTVTRFGTSQETAAVPGTTGGLPETGEPSPETIAPAPAETDPPVDPTPDTPAPDTPAPDTKPNEPVVTDPSEPGQDTRPPQTEPTETETEYDPFGDPPDMTTEEYDPPFGEKETETRREINDQAVNDFMGKMEGCASAMGLGITSLASVLAAAYVCIRKKDRNE